MSSDLEILAVWGLNSSCGDSTRNGSLVSCYKLVMTYYIAFRLTREGTVLDANEMYCDEAEAIERARALATDFPVGTVAGAAQDSSL